MPDDLLLSRDEVRWIDQIAVEELGITGLMLMENAARGVCDRILRMREIREIHIVCGPGNNGGDGFALARLLQAVGADPHVWLVPAGKPLTHDADVNRNILTAAGGTVRDAGGAADIVPAFADLGPNDLIVDCLLGTGVRGAVRNPFAEVIEAVNSTDACVLAVDVPSGLDCESGTADGVCIRADLTVTFVGIKKGFAAPGADRFTGPVETAHIGLPAAWVRRRLASYRADGV